jgi:hypothetical protein
VAQRVGRGIALLSMTAAMEDGEWSAARLDRTLPQGKTRYPFYRRLGGPQGRSGRAEKSRPHQDFSFVRYTFIDPSIHKLQRLHGMYLSNVFPCVSDWIVRCVILGP